MNVSSRSNRSAETAGDFVVAQVDVSTAPRADCRSSRAADLLLPFTVKTLDDRAVLLFPKLLKLPEDRGAGWGGRGRFFADSQLQAGFRSKRREVATALATHRALRRCILHLLEATVWTFKADFCRRRTGHRTLTPDSPVISALQMLP